MAYKSSKVQVEEGSFQLTEYNQVKIDSIRNDDNSVDAVDIRQWYMTKDCEEYRPTQKGIRVPADYIPNLIEILQRLV